MNIQPFRHHRILIPALLLSALALTSCGGNEHPKDATESSVAPTAKSTTAMSSASPSPVAGKTTAKSGMGMKPQADGKCATDEPIVGKLTKNGNKIYHEPGSLNYEKVKATECFKTAADAEKAGYRPIKSNTTHKDSDSKKKN
jgi:hypothetical protein